MTPKVRNNLLNCGIKRIHHGILGEVVENSGVEQLPDLPTGIQGDHIGCPVLHQQRANCRVSVRLLVLNDFNVRILRFKIIDNLLEVLESLPLELEEVESGHPFRIARASARAQCCSKSKGCHNSCCWPVSESFTQTGR